jgi:hypothetical protein
LLNEIEKSIYYSGKAILLLKEFNHVRFPSEEVPYSNLQLASIFQDINNLPTILQNYKLLYDSVEVEENKILIDINYAGLLLLSNNSKNAFKVLKNCNYIPNLEHDDYYYNYYYWVNYSIVAFLLGHYEVARKTIKQLEEIVKHVSPFLSKYYAKHYTIITEIIFETDIKTYDELRIYINDRLPIYSSEIWKRFKIGYLFTDMQIWLSS